MTKRQRRPGRGDPKGCVVTVCRGCCCGTTAKHPDVDHPGQLAQLRAGIGGTGQIRTSDCLDACEHSNVIVVTPTPAGRHRGARPVWLGEILEPDTIATVTEWIAAGGPGIAEPTDTIDAHTFHPSRRVRLHLDQG